MKDSHITVEVVYGLPHDQALIKLSIEEGNTAEEAIEASGVLRRFPDIDLSATKIGIWNRTCKLSDIPKDGDRIEIYRPLIADPKEVRRIRAEKAKVEGRADKVTGGRVKS